MIPPETVADLFTDRVPFLLSFWYYKRQAIPPLTRGLRLIMDSGAFSAYTRGREITVADYAGWLVDNKGYFDFAFNLDKLYDPEGSWVNWQRLRDLGCDTVPVVHYGTSLDEFDRYADDGANLVGLGGIAVMTGDQPMIWLRAAVARCRQLGVAAHALGFTRAPVLWRMPIWSVDSSVAMNPMLHAGYSLWDPETKRLVKITNKTKATPDLLRMLRLHYHADAGTRVFRIERPTKNIDRLTHHLLALWGMRLMSNDLVARHHVPGPPGADEGTVIWSVTTDQGLTRRTAAYIGDSLGAPECP